MKKILKGFIIAVLCILLGVVIYNIIPKSLSNFYDEDKIDDKIYLVSGSTGNTILLDEEQQIKILEYINNIKVSRKFFQEARTGWDYSIKIYQGDKYVDIVVGLDRFIVNKKNYKISDKQKAKELLDYCKTLVK